MSNSNLISAPTGQYLFFTESKQVQADKKELTKSLKRIYKIRTITNVTKFTFKLRMHNSYHQVHFSWVEFFSRLRRSIDCMDHRYYRVRMPTDHVIP